MRDLKEFKNNITSQYGEDGIIQEIFNRIGAEDPFCIEFGAWDGKFLSNVWDLWHNKNWKALLIEADSEKCQSLSDSTKSFQNVTVYNAFVTPTGENSIGMILKTKALPDKVDLLSIDIDGNDYYIFEKLEHFTARLIIVEYNPTIPPHLNIIQEQDKYFGASALALHKLANAKGYKLAAITDTNLFFVMESEFSKLGINELDLKYDFLPNHLTYIYTSYDGVAFVDRIPSYLSNKMNSVSNEIEQIYAGLPKVKKVLGSAAKLKIAPQKLPKFKSEIPQIPVRIFKE